MSLDARQEKLDKVAVKQASEEPSVRREAGGYCLEIKPVGFRFHPHIWEWILCQYSTPNPVSLCQTTLMPTQTGSSQLSVILLFGDKNQNLFLQLSH